MMGDSGEFVAHTVRVDFTDGWTAATMICPYDVTDPERPCWPHDEDGERSQPGDFCNWSAWFDGGGMDTVVGTVAVDLVVAKAEWDGDSFRFGLANPAPHIGRDQP